MGSSERLTLILINAAAIMERADESLLPGVYKEVGEALHTDPTGLGSLTLFRSIVQSLCYPLAAYLALRHNRAHVIALGAFLWAAATFLVAVSTTFLQVAISRGLNGIGLAIVTPAIHSLIADLTEDHNRGIAFGWLQFTGNVGAIIGSFFSILLASTSFMGIAGWRIAFHLVAIVSVLVGILVRLYANDPHFTGSVPNDKSQLSPIQVKELVKEAKKVIGIPSFQVIVAQGVSGSFAGSAYSFIPMWLELIGFSHKTTGVLWTIFIVGFSIGGLFGGKMGDKLAKVLPNSGRIILSQISAGSAIFLTAILLLVLPDDPSSGFMHGVVFLIMGLCTSWNAPATNNPIFAEIVPERSRTSIYALDQSFENILASFAPPLVGILAQQVYGYKPVQKGSTDSQEIATDRENAAVLSKALYTAIGIPFTVCCIVYSFLYCTYPRDRDRARMDALIDSEMLQVESDNILPAEELYLQVQTLKSDEKLANETRADYAGDYQGNDTLDFDENDGKRLLSHQHYGHE